MKTVLLVHAHPDPHSLTAQMVQAARAGLRAQGHEVIQSDLYAMGWKAVYDEHDFPDRQDREHLSFVDESGHAFSTGTQPAPSRPSCWRRMPSSSSSRCGGSACRPS